MEFTQTDLFGDICVRRHRKNPESVAANPTPETKLRTRERIIAMLKEKPATSKDLCAALGLGDKISLISGRLSELKATGIIEPSGVQQDGCAVLRLK